MFDAIVNRTFTSESWQKIPWDDPDFSRRMLQEHLSQTHDAASRRTTIIDRHVAWIDGHVLAGKPSRVLDLGCGPGLYSAWLQALGHTCTGIDFSPASVDFARANSPCTYVQGDVREVEFGTGYDLVMMIYGELNTFTRDDAQRIVDKAYAALKPGGLILLEPHTYEAVERLGQQPASWYAAQAGLFSDEPFLCLEESFFRDDRAVTRFYVIDAQSGQMTPYGSMTQAYREADYRDLLRVFGGVTFYPSLDGESADEYLCAVVARKPRA